MKTQYKITFEYFDWLAGMPTLGTLIVQAPNKDFAIKQYYQARGKKISHDTLFVSIEEISC